MLHQINNLKKDTEIFLFELGIDNYHFEENGSLVIPIGWKGRYNKITRHLNSDEAIIIDYIEKWG